jgi:hypothetical protein
VHRFDFDGNKFCIYLKGLFHRAIGESGSVLSGWGLNGNGGVKATSLKIAELAGCPLEPYQDLLSCVQNTDAAVLSTAMQEYTVSFYNI